MRSLIVSAGVAALLLIGSLYCLSTGGETSAIPAKPAR